MGHLLSHQDPETSSELYWNWTNLLYFSQLCTLGKPRKSTWMNAIILEECWGTLRNRAIKSTHHKHLLRERRKAPIRCTLDSNHRWGHSQGLPDIIIGTLHRCWVSLSRNGCTPLATFSYSLLAVSYSHGLIKSENICFFCFVNQKLRNLF